MRIYLPLLLTIFSETLVAQSKQANDSLLRHTLQQLKGCSENTYQNRSTGQWWHNKMFINYNTLEMNIKNAASEVPHKVNKQVYYDRKFILNDLDPRTIQVLELKQDEGRMAKGKAIQVHVFGNEKRIQKSFNGRASLKEFFLQMAFPASEDSLYKKAEACAQHLKNAIKRSAEIYATQTSDDPKRLFGTLPGKYSGSDGTSCHVTTLFPYALEFNAYRQEKLYRKSILTYDSINHRFAYSMFNQAGDSHHSLAQKSGNRIALIAGTQDFALEWPSLHRFTLVDKQAKVSYHRVAFSHMNVQPPAQTTKR